MNAEKEFTEKDWKLYRLLIGQWQNRYIDQLNNEYISILSQDKSPEEKFWEVEKRIRNDRHHPGVIVEMKRSNMVMTIIELLNDGVIEMSDLDGFSELLKDRISTLIEINKRYY